MTIQVLYPFSYRLQQIGLHTDSKKYKFVSRMMSIQAGTYAATQS